MRRVLAACVATLAMGACGGGQRAPRTVPRAAPPRAASRAKAPPCADEARPECWLQQLGGPSLSASDIERVEQLLHASAGSAGGKQLLDRIVEPLTRTYVEHYAELDVSTRVALIRILSKMRDPRTAPALVKAFDEYARQPPRDRHERDVIWAAQAQTDLRLASVGDALLRAFLAFQTHTMLGGLAYRDVNQAMGAAPQRSWVKPLIGVLAAEMVVPTKREDEAAIDAYRDQQFWQTTAAFALGELRAPEAVDPLLRELLDPAKADVQTTAALALVKIGEPAEQAAIRLLKGEDASLVAFSAARDPHRSEPWVATAALVLGTIGLPGARQPMMDVSARTAVVENKAVVARELSQLPATPQSERAFERAYASIPVDFEIPPGVNGLQMLTDAAKSFRDPAMVAWLLERAAKTKGSREDLVALRAAILVTTLELATSDQLAAVKKAVDAYGTKLERDALELARQLLARCGDRVACYLDAVADPGNQGRETQFAGIKAATMIGVLGDADSAEALVDALGSVDNAAIRFVAAGSIDHLLPNGSAALADKLEAIIARDRASPDARWIFADAPLKQVAYRLRTRAR